jgi:hypothetical protein
LPVPTAEVKAVAVKVVVLPCVVLKVPRAGVSIVHVGAILALLELALLQVAVRLFDVPVLTETNCGEIEMVRVSDTSRLLFFVQETISIVVAHSAAVTHTIRPNFSFMFCSP